MSQAPHKSVDIVSAYDCWAATYDVTPNVTRDLDAAVLRRQTFALADCDVLEIGCGTGKNTAWLAECARSVIAMDVSAGMLAQARQRVRMPRVQYVQHDIQVRWPLADASVDLVVGNLVLEHIEALDVVFQQAFRVLRPGGEYFVCEFHPFRQITGGQAQFPHPDTGHTTRITAFIHDVSDYVNAAVNAGFHLVRTDDWRNRLDAPRTEVPRLFSLRCRRPS
jgi:malonyl-CoA O-methyltransferase